MSAAITHIRPTLIRVGSHAAIAGQKLFCGSRWIADVNSDGKWQIAMVPVTPSWLRRCNNNGCMKWTKDTADNRLGFTGYCTPCVEYLAVACEAAHGRLPGPGEFYCAGCGRIASVECQPTDNGQQRLRCHDCRKRQWALASQNRRARQGGRIHAA